MKKTTILLIVLLCQLTLGAQQLPFYTLTSGGLNTVHLKSTAAEVLAGRYDGTSGSLIYGFNYSFSYNQSTIIPDVQDLSIIITNRKITLNRQYNKASILNLNGQTVFSSVNIKEIILDRLPQGIYLLKIRDRQGSHVYKFIHY